MGDDPPFLSVGTEVSAKYKGAFCEAKVRKVVKSIKCKVMFKLGLGSAVVSDDQIKGLLRVGAQVEAKHPEKGQYVEAVINKIQDCSQYTVVFDDGDITTLRRTSLCLKSGRHFAESETLDQLPLTHPEHFGTPVLGGRRGGRKRDDSSDEDDEASESSQQEQSRTSKKPEEKEPNIGKVVCVEVSEKKKGKESWFPGLIVAPTAQDAVPIRVKDEYLVRSFKDGRYYTVPKKEATEFTREVAQRTEQNALKAAIEKALLYLDRDELPPHWDREVLFGLDDASSVNESKGGSDAESSDDETREEKDHFVAQLYKFMDDNGTPINKGPTINSRDLDLYRLFKIVNRMGGFNRVTNQNGWKAVTEKMVLNSASNSVSLVKQAYKKYLYGFEDFYRKLGCTMNSPRSVKSRSRPGRSLIRDKDRATSGASTPKREPEDEEEKPKTEESATSSPVEPPKAVNNTEDQTPCVNVEEEESEEPATASQQPARKQRERSVPARLLDSITPKSAVKKEEDSGGDDANDQENESNSNQSMRSQRTRTRTPRERLEESDQQDSVRSARKRGKCRGEDKANDDEDKIPRSKPKDEDGNPKDETEKKAKKEDIDKKNRTPGREGKSKTRKNDENKGEDSKKVDDENGSVDAEEPAPKRRGRKPRAVAESDDDENGKLPPNVDVQIGDKLKVYYCPMQDSKVTYEAKVCEIRIEGVKKLYLVHYTGWNTRYDEWIKRSRIAENLTWTPNRKRSKSVHSQEKGRSNIPSHGSKNPTGKRGRARGQDSSRSATPSSVTSTSSTGQRNVNASGEDGAKRPPSKSNRRRSRRISEMSGASAGSLESSDDEDEEEVGSARVRKKLGNKVAESEESEPVYVDEADQTPRRRAHHRRKNSETDSNSVDTRPVTDANTEGGAPSTPVRRGRRRAITAPETTLPDVAAVKKEPEDEEKILNDSSNDLNQAADVSNEADAHNTHNKGVRTEAKLPLDVSTTSIVKTSSAVPPPSSQTTDVSGPVNGGAPPSTEPVAAACTSASVIQNSPSVSAHSGSPSPVASPPDSTATAGGSVSVSESNLAVVSTATPLVVPSVVVSATSPAAQQSPEPQKMGPRDGNDDDVYEFREPEPFAFEVRSRRESPFSEDRVSNRLSPRKSPKDEEDEHNKKPTAANTASAERNKSVITSPPRRSCVTSATSSEDPELCPSEQQGLSVLPSSPKNNLEVIPRDGALVGRSSPKRSLSPQPVHSRAAQEPASKESVKTAVAVPVISAAAIQLPNITQVLPALSALAARSMPPSSRVSAIVSPPSAKSDFKLDASVVNTAAKEEERSDCDEAENGVGPQETVDETKINSSPKRRKVSGKKVLSQEFVESDEDSPNDQTSPSADGPHQPVEEEVPDAVTPNALVEESGLDTNVREELLTPSKIKENSNSSRNKTEEDLDESSLLCEETIPGSPVTHCMAPSAENADASVIPIPSTSRSTEMPFASAPSAPNLPRTRGLSGGPNSAGRANRKRSLRETLAMQRPGIRPGNGSSLMMENTPPTTPDGSISSSSNSPQGDHYGGLSPDHESSVKSERELSESDNQIPSSQSSHNAGSVSAARSVGPRATATAQPVTAPVIKRKDEEPQRQQAQHQDDESPVKRRRRGGTAPEPSSGKKGRGHGRSPRRTGSDSEDTAAEYVHASHSGTLVSMSGYIPRSTRYNFCTDLDPDLDASQRIASLQEKLRELRQTYSALKARVVMIDRRRKKLKRKEKESSS